MFDSETYPPLSSPTALVMRAFQAACHTSHVTRHTSHVTRHTSRVTGDILHDWSDEDAVVIIKAAAEYVKRSNSSKHRIMIVFRPLVDGGSFISTFGEWLWWW
jgi:hypothetical protein